MPDEPAETTQGPSEVSYEPPAIATVGSTADMTAGDTDSSPTLDSDRRLKHHVASVERPLARLRAIRTR